MISGADLLVGWKRDGDRWVTPLETRPQKVLCDGQPWNEFSYDAEARQMLVRGRDPRLHTIESVVREHGLDLAGRKVRVEGVAVVDVTGTAVVGQENAKLTGATDNGGKER